MKLTPHRLKQISSFEDFAGPQHPAECNCFWCVPSPLAVPMMNFSVPLPPLFLPPPLFPPPFLPPYIQLSVVTFAAVYPLQPGLIPWYATPPPSVPTPEFFAGYRDSSKCI